MKNTIIAAMITGIVLTFTGTTLANAELTSETCTATCYKADALR